MESENLEEKSVKRSERKKRAIRKFASIFLIVLLILTFFSNTILNYSLPEVSTVNVSGGNVAQKVRCQGTVATCADVEITVSGERVVKEVLVESGDQVAKGQTLIKFDCEENKELKEAEDALKAMQEEYDKMVMTLGADHTDENVAIANQQRSVNDAAEAVEQAKRDSVTYQNLQAEFDALKAALDAKNQEISNLQASSDSYKQIGDYTEATALKATLEENLAKANLELSDLNEDLERQNALEASGTTEEGDEPLVEGVDSSKVVAIKRSIRDKEAEIKKLEEDLTAVNTLLESLNGSVDIDAALAAAKAEAESLTLQLEDKKAEVDAYAAKPSVKDAEDALTKEQQTLDSLKRSLARTLQQEAIDKHFEDLSIEKKLEDIEEKKKEIEKIKATNDAEQIVASADGIISNISLKVGDKISPDTPIATIQLLENGYEVVTTMSKNDARLLKVGDEATIENVWGSDVSSSIKSIKADPSNPNQSMIVKFDVKGDVNIGETLSFAVGEKSKRYDTVVPSNAVGDDINGKFVLVAEVKSTPLGNRYVVRKVDVKVLAEDTNKVAISGDITEYDNVITNSSKPIENGQQIRLTEN